MKRIVSMTMALLMVLVLLPTSVHAAGPMYSLGLHVADVGEDNIPSVEVGVTVEADSFLKGEQKVLLAIDAEAFDFVDRWGEKLQIVYDGQNLILAPGLKDAIFSNYGTEKVFVAQSPDKKTVFVSITLNQNAANYSILSEKKIMRMELSFKEAYDKDAVVRFATRAEADMIGHNDPVVLLRGGNDGKHIGKFRTKGSLKETNNIAISSFRHYRLPDFYDPIWCSDGACYYWSLYEDGVKQGDYKDSDCTLEITNMVCYQQEHKHIKSHIWEDVVYEWSEDNKACKAVRVCKRDETHKEYAYAKVTFETKEPNCTEEGEITYTAEFAEPWAWAREENPETHEMEIVPVTSVVKLPVVEDAHKWGDWNYAWSLNHVSCVAWRVCEYNPDHVEKLLAVNENVSEEIEKLPTYYETGISRFTAVFDYTPTGPDDKLPETQRTEYVVTAKLQHNWDEPEYVWSEDNNTCKATCHCFGVPSYVIYPRYPHDESTAITIPDHMPHDVEIVANDVKWELISDATCTEGKKYKVTATFSSEYAWATKQVKEVEVEPALGHKWGEVTYEWKWDNSKHNWACTATRACQRKIPKEEMEKSGKEYVCKEVETALAEVDFKVTQPTYYENGNITYVARFSVDWADSQVKIQTLPFLSVDWDNIAYTVTYVWVEHEHFDGSISVSCVAQRVADDNPNAVEYAEGIVDNFGRGVVTKPATCEEVGETTYTATFSVDWAETATKTIKDIRELGHDWKETIYVWAEDGSSCIAKRICDNDHAHDLIAKATITSEVTKAPTSVTNGETTYTAIFAEEWANTQCLTLADIVCGANAKPVGLLGDVTGDGIADNLDATLILKIDAGLAVATDLVNLNGDVSGDGVVDNMDAVKILKLDAGLILKF